MAGMPKPNFERDGVSLYHGDCMDVLRKMPDSSVDLIATDPPYGVDYQSAWRTDAARRHKRIANDKQPFVWWLKDAARILRDGGGMLCFCRWDVSHAFRSAIEWSGLKIRAEVIWDRMAHGMGDPASCPGPQHDTAWYATKGRRVWHDTRPKSVVRAMRVSGTKLTHPNEKPLELMSQLIGDYAAPDDVVLDCFAGSGATLEACQRLGRNAIGIEMDDKYFTQARERVSRTADTLFAGVKHAQKENQSTTQTQEETHQAEAV